MLTQIAATITQLFFLVHTTLYAPTFPPLPIVRPFPVELHQTFTLPVKKLTATQVPPIAAGAFLVIDKESGEVLAEKDADVPLSPASTTKIMTALIALEMMDQDQLLTVPADLPREGSLMNLEDGEQIRVRDVVTGLLIRSSNDAAELLAYSFPGGKDAFIFEMNKKARELGMIHTLYQNTSGLHEVGHVMTVRDLLILARYAMKNETFAQIVSQKSAVVYSADGKISHPIETTNQLLGTVDGVEGIKTGYTEEAGECLVTQVTREGNTILTAILKSPDRFMETKTLIAWVYNGFTWQTKTASQWE